MTTRRADLIVAGGGIVGLATAWRFMQRHPGKTALVLEKDVAPGLHQTGHNSGVLHSGIYYKPGSLKAVLCRRGKALMEAFCRDHGVPYDICGKVVVALDASEVPALDRIADRAARNGVDARRISVSRLRELEPETAGVDALHVPETGITDYGRVCETLAELIRSGGGETRFGVRVGTLQGRHDGAVAHTDVGDFEGRLAVGCAGLFSDRLARASGNAPDARIVPFRGEYWELVPEARGLVKNLIYPVPDPNFPFLGVHFTRMIGGGVECGPNAVLAFAREGYTRTAINLRDLAETVTWPGFWRLVRRHGRAGMGELHRSFSKSAFVAALSRLLPAIRAEHLMPAPAGVRAQALARDGGLVDDFLFVDGPSTVHVCNAPSPAATSSLAIADTIVDRLKPATR